MAQSRNDIQKKSDEKRGVKLCSFKLKLETIAKLERMAEEENLSKTALLEKLIHER